MNANSYLKIKAGVILGHRFGPRLVPSTETDPREGMRRLLELLDNYSKEGK